MSSIKIAFYKPPKDDFFGHLISGYTGLFNPNTPGYSHCEIGFLIDGSWKWYSSASRNTNGTTGTRWLENDVLFKHPERWDVYDVETVKDQWEMIERCDAELGKPYDWPGIMGFVTITGQLNLKNKWYCSEVCHYAYFGEWKKRVSPRKFYLEVKKCIVT